MKPLTMTTLTWLGEQDYGEGETPLSACTWNGVLFTAGDKVEVTDPWMIAKARGNRFFRVEDGNGKPRPGDLDQRPATAADRGPAALSRQRRRTIRPRMSPSASPARSGAAAARGPSA